MIRVVQISTEPRTLTGVQEAHGFIFERKYVLALCSAIFWIKAFVLSYRGSLFKNKTSAKS